MSIVGSEVTKSSVFATKCDGWQGADSVGGCDDVGTKGRAGYHKISADGCERPRGRSASTVACRK